MRGPKASNLSNRAALRTHQPHRASTAQQEQDLAELRSYNDTDSFFLILTSKSSFSMMSAPYHRFCVLPHPRLPSHVSPAGPALPSPPPPTSTTTPQALSTTTNPSTGLSHHSPNSRSARPSLSKPSSPSLTRNIPQTRPNDTSLISTASNRAPQRNPTYSQQRTLNSGCQA